MSIWDSFIERRQEFADNNDKERMRLAALHHEGFDCQETDPQRSVAIFSEGRQLAAKLGEPWWVFFYDVWRAMATNSYVQDAIKGLELAVAGVMEARKPQFADHAWRVAIFIELLDCYAEIDPAGYADEIEQTLGYLETIIPAGPEDDRLVILTSKRRFLTRVGRLEEARSVALDQLALHASDQRDDHWYGLGPVSFLCWLAGQEEDWPALAQHADLLEEWAWPIHAAQQERSEAAIWQALLARRAGEESSARRLHRSATARMRRLQMHCDFCYYDALALFHEHGGNLPAVVRVHDRELAQLAGKGCHFRECQVQLQRCRVLARMAKLRPSDLTAAHAAATKLRHPEKYVAELRALGWQPPANEA